MKYQALGKTGLNVSVIGFGGIPIQRIGQEAVTSLLNRAREAGINFIDSARGYTVSEQMIGTALLGRRDQWILSTKSMARDKIAMQNDIATSLRNFQTDRIDLYSIHNISSVKDLKRVFEPDGAYAALERAKAEGKIGHIGVTSHSLDTATEAIKSGKFESVMLAYNIIETAAEPVIQSAYEQGMGVIIMKPMAGGAIDDKQLAIRYILRNENVTLAIPGMAEPDEIAQNVSAAEISGPLIDHELADIASIRQTLGNAFCRRCGYCAPCPQGIVIPSMFLYSGYKVRYNLGDWAKSRYLSEKVRADACVECGICETRCPYQLPIRKMMKAVRDVFDT